MVAQTAPPTTRGRRPRGNVRPSPSPGALRGRGVVGGAAGGGGVWGTLEGGLHLGPSVPHSSPPALSFEFSIIFLPTSPCLYLLHLSGSISLSTYLSYLSTYLSDFPISQETDDKTIISVKLAKECLIFMFPLRYVACFSSDWQRRVVVMAATTTMTSRYDSSW